jgi:transposase-like protein
MAKRYSPEEIAAKLREADDLAKEGIRHRDIARRLGISVMTYHRWRRARSRQQDATSPVGAPPDDLGPLEQPESPDRLVVLQRENARLRRLVIDLLLEKVTLEEIVQRRGGR